MQSILPVEIVIFLKLLMLFFKTISAKNSITSREEVFSICEIDVLESTWPPLTTTTTITTPTTVRRTTGSGQLPIATFVGKRFHLLMRSLLNCNYPNTLNLEKFLNDLILIYSKKVKLRNLLRNASNKA